MYPVIKRLIDIIVAGFLLILLSPLFIIIIVILKFTGEGEVFYGQQRIGYKNKPFFIWKFATMLKNSLEIGNKDVTVRNDPRITSFGKTLRLSKLNELPQLFNVLVGEMSIIGPRPLLQSGFKRFSDEVQDRIYHIRPGVTGIGSVIFRDEEAFVSRQKDYLASYQYINNCKGELENWYQKRMGFLTDCAIVFLTAWVIVVPKSSLPYKIFKDLPQFPRYHETMNQRPESFLSISNK